MTDSASLRTRIPRKAVSTSSNITRARWTENEEKTIKQQLLSGKSPHEIQLPGRTSSSIRSKIRQMRKEIGPIKSPILSAQTQSGPSILNTILNAYASSPLSSPSAPVSIPENESELWL
jgi:hypothetical protein